MLMVSMARAGVIPQDCGLPRLTIGVNMTTQLETQSTVDAGRRVETFVSQVQSIRRSLHEVVVGQDRTIDLLLTCALTGSHALLVGVPGLAKTLMVKALASAFRWKFSRVQFTPDLMPSDITGYELLGAMSRPARRR